MKTELTTIDTQELSDVTGGANLFQNMGRGAGDLANGWSRQVSRTVGGPLGQIFGGFAGLTGIVVGGIGGATHTLGLNREP